MPTFDDIDDPGVREQASRLFEMTAALVRTDLRSRLVTALLLVDLLDQQANGLSEVLGRLVADQRDGRPLAAEQWNDASGLLIAWQFARGSLAQARRELEEPR